MMMIGDNPSPNPNPNDEDDGDRYFLQKIHQLANWLILSLLNLSHVFVHFRVGSLALESVHRS